MFSKKLKELRQGCGYSMDTLIELYNKKFNGKMNKSTLSRYENGLQKPTYTVVVNLAEIFNVSIDYILGNTATKENTASAESLQFGSRIIEAREQKGISQKRLAEILKISPTRLNYWEKGKREPNIKMLKKIAHSLNVSLDYLLSSPTVPPTLLSAEEEKLLRLYNSADAYGKETILLFAEREATRK